MPADNRNVLKHYMACSKLDVAKFVSMTNSDFKKKPVGR